MKKILLLVLCCVCTIQNYAQLKVAESGRLYIGIPDNDVPDLAEEEKDTVTMCRIYGPYGEMRAGGRISFGDQNGNYALNAMIGELGRSDMDKLWLQGKYGLYITSGIGAVDTLFYYDSTRGNYFQFNGDVRTTGIFVTSDSRFKDDITPLQNTLSGLKSLSAVKYTLKPIFTEPSSSLTRSSLDEFEPQTEKDRKDAEFFSTYYKNLKNDTPRFGFLAQEVKEVFPELVRTDSAGYMYVDYIGMIPLVVNALNEIQARVDSQETVIAELQQELVALKNGDVETASPLRQSERNTAAASSGSAIVPALYQNNPNPFSAATTIRFALPYETAQADLYIYDMQGTQIRRIEIADRGEGHVTLQGAELSAGMYIYSLIADGKEIDSKRMILTK